MMEEIRKQIHKGFAQTGKDVWEKMGMNEELGVAQRMRMLEDRLDALITVVEEIVHARWCEGRDTNPLVLGGSLRDLGLWSEEKMTKWERGDST